MRSFFLFLPAFLFLASVAAADSAVELTILQEFFSKGGMENRSTRLSGATLEEFSRRPMAGVYLPENATTAFRLLVENTAHGFEDGFLPVSDGYHDAGIDREAFCARRNGIEARLEVCAYAFQVLRRDVFHLNLVIAIPRIDIVKLLLARRPAVRHGSRI